MSAPDLIPVEVNIPLLRKAVEWAEAEAALGPMSQWVQGWWKTEPDAVSGSWAWKIRNGYLDIQQPVAPECGTTYCIAGYVCHQIGHDKPLASWSADAQDALGIGPGQANALFDAGNTIADVRRIAEDIAGERL